MGIPTKKFANGFEMPVFGLGTYGFGLNPNSEQAEITAVKTAIELGVSHIDTAEAYADGKSESLVSQGIKGFDRQKLFLVSKVAAINLNYQGIHTAILKSLERMGLDYLDMYLMHRCPPEHLLDECAAAMDELVDKKLVRYIGLSDTNTPHADKLQKLSNHKFMANQVHYNLEIREVEKEGLLNYCQNNDMMLIAWRPVNKGVLAKSGVNLTAAGITPLDEMAKKYQKTQAQIAINWLISQKNVVTLAKSTNLEHLKENLGSADWTMETADIEKLRNEFPHQQPISDTVPLG